VGEREVTPFPSFSLFFLVQLYFFFIDNMGNKILTETEKGLRDLTWFSETTTTAHINPDNFDLYGKGLLELAGLFATFDASLGHSQPPRVSPYDVLAFLFPSRIAHDTLSFIGTISTSDLEPLGRDEVCKTKQP
jgi:hypothetical protein